MKTGDINRKIQNVGNDSATNFTNCHKRFRINPCNLWLDLPALISVSLCSLNDNRFSASRSL